MYVVCVCVFFIAMTWSDYEWETTHSMNGEASFSLTFMLNVNYVSFVSTSYILYEKDNSINWFILVLSLSRYILFLSRSVRMFWVVVVVYFFASKLCFQQMVQDTTSIYDDVLRTFRCPLLSSDVNNLTYIYIRCPCTSPQLCDLLKVFPIKQNHCFYLSFFYYTLFPL